MLTFLTLAALALPLQTEAAAPETAPARALLMELTSTPRLAGTVGSRWSAQLVARWLQQAGFEVQFDEREVLLTYPRRIELALYEDGTSEKPLLHRIDVFDPDAIPAGDVPRFNAWAASGRVRAEVVDCGSGLRGDFESLVASGTALAGRIALIRYGGSYRGVKVDLATEFGCAGVLLFSDPKLDGPGKGEVWPNGPWKPAWAAQRGSISPMGKAPGDATTPGFGSPAPESPDGRERISGQALADILPTIPCLPIGSDEAEAILSRLQDSGGGGIARLTRREAIEVEIVLDQPRSLRRIVNVIATLAGESPERVIAGNHRDAWVRGAHDAGGGTVSLVRAAQRIGQRVRAGWRPKHTLQLAFWDAEEFGLVGSTEWVESNRDRLRADAILYLNADAAVSGTEFSGLSGSPGLLRSLQVVLSEIPSHSFPDESLWQEWERRMRGRKPELTLPGSGSDFAAFLHHATLPVLDFSLKGSSGGQYHTAFDDFPLIDRFLDPGFIGHELAGRILEALLVHFLDEGRAAFDPEEAALAMESIARAAGEEVDAAGARWLGTERGERLAQAFHQLASALAKAEAGSDDARYFYTELASEPGLPGRPWFKNVLWAPGLETGYSSETLPLLRSSAVAGEVALDAALASMIASVEDLTERTVNAGGE